MSDVIRFDDSAMRNVYGLLTGDEDARVCKDIPDSACNDQPRNFVLQLLAQSATSIGDQLVNAKLILPWLLAAVGAPAFLIGWLVPVRESLSLLPQLFVAEAIRRQPLRKWYWIGGALGQATGVFGMALAIVTLHGTAAGIAMLACLVLFSLARGVCSVASKDVLGKTVSKTRRGTLSGYAAGIGGFAALAVGVGAMIYQPPAGDILFFLLVLATAGLLWLLGALAYANLAEQPGATSGGRNAAEAALEAVSLVTGDKPFRRLLVTRTLLLASALVAPFYVALAHRATEGTIADLGFLIVAAGLANSASAPVWGRLADKSSRRVLVYAALTAGLLGFALLAILGQGGTLANHPLLFAAAVFILGIAHSGIRLGRKTYLLDIATLETRASYVAVSNTLIGIFLLTAGALTTLVPGDATTGVILVLSVFCLLGAASAWRMDEA